MEVMLTEGEYAEGFHVPATVAKILVAKGLCKPVPAKPVWVTVGMYEVEKSADRSKVTIRYAGKADPKIELAASAIPDVIKALQKLHTGKQETVTEANGGAGS